jgi:hypothetical protein
VTAIVGASTRALATVAAHDHEMAGFFAPLAAGVEVLPAAGEDDLACLRRHLFDDTAPPARQLDGSLEFFSAPGEGREAVEIARRVLQEARRGVRFDEMAILVRSPHSYFGLLEHALGRAGVPAWFDRGSRRPHPAGRALLALLACRAEHLSAARFAEYLSLGQVPQPGAEAAAPAAASRDEMLDRTPEPEDDERAIDDRRAAAEPVDERSAVAAGTLRAPWRWEKFLIDTAVIGQDVDRWRRRLDGKAHEIARQIEEASREEGDDAAAVLALRQTQEQLAHLRAFALPIVETLANWPARATWGEWLTHFGALAPRVLRVPTHVLRVLADLRPMADVGPIDLDEARRVLAERLLTLETEPPARRFGRIFVGAPHQARGRAFRVVFVPGLAERMFPQKPREDALLLDGLRSATDASLRVQRTRLSAERLLLQLAAGAAAERLYVSYPRLELSESRARVPSFYALDVMRAVTGRIPDHEALEERGRAAGQALLAWPAPPRPEHAIDNQEHDLAVLRRLLDEPERAAVRGHAHYLLKLNECLRRSVIDRWSRGQRRWSPSDGLTRVTPYTKAALAANRLAERPYSLTALQKFSACPYQFVLSAVYRLQPLQPPEPLQHMDPLTRGRIFHDMQARFFRALAARGDLPVTAATLPAARGVLDDTIAAVAQHEYQELAPAVERVWSDEIAVIRRDLHAWLDFVAEDGAEWAPIHFELGFGSPPGERDAASLAQPVPVGDGFKLRGAIDLIEEHRQTKVLRVTDHKTGRAPDRVDRVIVGGGTVLQPVLYALAVEAGLGRPVAGGRLFYCTSAGGFTPHTIPLTEQTRGMGLEVLEVIDRAVARGFLAAAPTADACSRCDFRPVCGPHVYERIQRKPQGELADLLALRSRA